MTQHQHHRRRRLRQTSTGGLWVKIRDHKKLARLMLIQGVSHRDLAQAAGWRSHSIVGRIVRGELTTIDTDRALLIARCLQVPFDDLFELRVSSNSGSGSQSKGVA